MVNARLISKLALCGTFFALGVIALGAYTRLIDAGLGCPDWPGCYGHVAVSFINNVQQFSAHKAWAEMIHRYFVGGLSLFILTIVILLFKNTFSKNTNNQNIAYPCGNIILAVFLILLLMYQIMLGRWTVTLKLLPIIVTQHLLGGFLILSTLWLIYLNNSNVKNKFTKSVRKIFPWAFIAVIILLMQITLGAWTSTNYASLSCPDFPFCMNDNPFMSLHLKAAFNIFSPVGVNYEGGVLPEEVRQTIQMMHRIGALVFTTYILILLGIAFPRLKKSPELLKLLYLIVGLLCVQLSLGISNVIFKLPLLVAVSHNLTAVILLLTLITFTFKLTLTEIKAVEA